MSEENRPQPPEDRAPSLPPTETSPANSSLPPTLPTGLRSAFPPSVPPVPLDKPPVPSVVPAATAASDKSAPPVPDAPMEAEGEELTTDDLFERPEEAADRSQSAAPAPETTNRFQEIYRRITEEVAKVFVGQEELVTGTMVAIFSAGHVLIESVPGLGKTLFVRTLGKCLGCQFGRIQFTPDLMPSDITGNPVFDMKIQEFRFRPGPVFTQLLLADEINRSPAKTHAALLEAMQEQSVTVDNVTHPLQSPFFVLATQNPIESEGTYHLPEAQVDRFMFKLVADYPTEKQEAEILALHGKRIRPEDKIAAVKPVTTPDEIMELSEAINSIYIAPKLIDYINQIVRKTRQWPSLSLGSSPRAGIALMTGSRTLAAFRGRDYVIPDDIIHLALPTLRHRVILSPESEVEGERVDSILTRLVRSVEIPRT